MKKYREDIKTIGEVVFFILIYLSLSNFNSPLYVYLVVTIYVIYWATNFYSKIRYRKGKANYILFPTKNDEYSKMTSITIGSMLLLAAIAFLFWKKSSVPHYTIIGLIAGILVLLNGIFDLPKGRILIQNSKVLFSGLESLDQKSLQEIHISKEQIRIKTSDGRNLQLNNLLIDVRSAKLINSYLDQRISNPECSILTNID